MDWNEGVGDQSVRAANRKAKWKVERKTREQVKRVNLEQLFYVGNGDCQPVLSFKKFKTALEVSLSHYLIKRNVVSSIVISTEIMM